MAKKVNIKKEKAPKVPKTPKKSKEKKERAVREVAFYRSIQFRLILSFFVPVICIIVLGVASNQKASSALIENYEASVSQTMDMMQQYVSLIVSSERDTFKPYLNNADMKKYMGGLMSAEDAGATRKSFQSEFRNAMALDTKLKDVSFLADDCRTICSDNASFPDNAYTTYLETPQGQAMMEDEFSWYVFGQDSATDEAFGIDTSSYALRLVRKLPEAKAAMMISIDADYIRTAMQSMDPGTNGYVVLVTSDGQEFYSDETLTMEQPLVYNTDYYQLVMASEEINGTETVNIGGNTYLFVYSKLTSGDALVATLVPEERIISETEDIQNLTMALTLVAAVIALLLGTLMSRRMSGTIKYILRQLHKVSKGDLTVHLTAKTKDEFGMLCAGVNETVEHVKGLIIHVNEVSAQLNQAAAHVSETSSTFMETSNDIQNVVAELEVGVNKLDSGSEDCLTQMDSLSGKISNVSLNADEIGKLTASAGNTINSGIASVQGLTESAKSTSEITQNVITAIEELEEKSKTIHKIIQDINDIAEQTNLLSLNASIEAARAGEAGRGFAVVAEEIRKLSDQCQDSAGKIALIVNEIVSKTGDVVEIARQAEEVVSSQTGAVEQTTNSFRLIDQQVALLLEALGTITNNVEAMSNSRNETLEAIESISAVSAETAACSTSVHDTAGTQLSAIKDLEDASEDLRQRADRLVEILGTFRV